MAPGPGGAHAHADPTGDAGVAVGGVRAALLVADEDVAQLGVVAEDVVERQDHAARVAEEDVDTLAQERLAQDVRADAGPLEVATLVEHPLPGALDRGGVGRAVIGDVAAPRAGWRRGPRRVRRISLGDRHLVGSSVWFVVGKTKDPRRPGEGPEVGRWWSSLAALVPPCPSVPPGAGNKPKKATKPRNASEEVRGGIRRPDRSGRSGRARGGHPTSRRRRPCGDLRNRTSPIGSPRDPAAAILRRAGSLAGIGRRVNRPPMVPAWRASHAVMSASTRRRSISQSVLRLSASRSSGSVDGRSVGRPSR